MNQTNKSWHWIEYFFKRVPLPYPLISFIISLVIYFIYVDFSAAINYNMISSDHIVAISMGLLIGYQLGSIYYLLNILKILITNLNDIFEEHNSILNIGYNFFVSPWHYVISLCVIAPFYLIDWIPFNYSKIYSSFFRFSVANESKWIIPFNIFMDVVGLLALILLSSLLWIMLNNTYILMRCESIAAGSYPSTNAHIVMIKMQFIRSLLSTTILFILISISLLIFSYINPFKLYSFEIIYILILLFISLSLYFFAKKSTNQILQNKIIYEIELINKKNQELMQRLFSILSLEERIDENNEANRISKILEILEKEREQLEGIYPKRYSLRSISTIIFAFSGSFLIPLALGLLKVALEDAGIRSQIGNIILEIIGHFRIITP